MASKYNKAQEFPEIKRKIITSLLGKEENLSTLLFPSFNLNFFNLVKTNHTKSSTLVLTHGAETESACRKDHALENEHSDSLQIPFMPMELLTAKPLELAID